MELERIITSTIVLMPEQVTEILKQHFKAKGFDVEKVDYTVENVTYGPFDRYGSNQLTRIVVTQTLKESQIL